MNSLIIISALVMPAIYLTRAWKGVRYYFSTLIVYALLGVPLYKYLNKVTDETGLFIMGTVFLAFHLLISCAHFRNFEKLMPEDFDIVSSIAVGWKDHRKSVGFWLAIVDLMAVGLLGVLVAVGQG